MIIAQVKHYKIAIYYIIYILHLLNAVLITSLIKIHYSDQYYIYYLICENISDFRKDHNLIEKLSLALCLIP